MNMNNNKKKWVVVTLILLHFYLFVNLQSGSCTCTTTADNQPNQQELDRVYKLPGQSFNVSFAHYSGYVKVNEVPKRELFYWFFEATEDASSKPLVLWLNGGPGCSSIAYGEAEEIGPFHIKLDGKTLYLNPYSWNQVLRLWEGEMPIPQTKAERVKELKILRSVPSRRSTYSTFILRSGDEHVIVVANILFLDSPAGVGFSYSSSSEDLLENGDIRTAKDSLEFLLKWFKRFPQFKGREFYITGESYAGHYVPQLAQAIVKYHQSTSDKSINLKGYMVGNALTDDYYDHLGVFQFMWSTGLISDQTYKLLNILCDYESFVHTSSQCDKMLDISSDEVGKIDPYSIFTPSCTSNGNLSNKLLNRLHIELSKQFCKSGYPSCHPIVGTLVELWSNKLEDCPTDQCSGDQLIENSDVLFLAVLAAALVCSLDVKFLRFRSSVCQNPLVWCRLTVHLFNIQCRSGRRDVVLVDLKPIRRVGGNYDPCTEEHSTVYFNSLEVQKALHVDSAVAPTKWETCSDLINNHWKDSPRSVLDVYHELINAGLRIWMFSGDTDSVIPVTSTRYSIDALKLPTTSPWRAWYHDGQVGGWTQQYAGLNFVTIRGAGHEVPLHRPELALVLIKAFLSGTQMPILSKDRFPVPTLSKFSES
ncbi:hypothetical protein IFM89_033957 [Coptis chinensis]|uniref:Carboxypeptidase n=1 Tax=Coptis chinensis TaxID=261450 RepID=A0A835HNY7_9MAGN|nr:hypothetical protein IFM89_033957 [Coptis chinensis]